MQRTTGELDASQGCRRQHPRDRGANGDYGQHGHQRVARDEDEYKVGDDLYMHAHKIGTYMHMQICCARMHVCIITLRAHGVPARWQCS